MGESKNPKGRPRLIDKGGRKRIIRALKRGDSLVGAAACVPCNYQTLRGEIKRNREFRIAVKKAQSAGKQRLLATLYRDAAKSGNGELALKVLRCRYPDEWSEKRVQQKRPAITNVSTNVTIAVEHRDTLLALAARLGARDVFDEIAVSGPSTVDSPPVGIGGRDSTPPGTSPDAVGPDAAAE